MLHPRQDNEIDIRILRTENQFQAVAAEWNRLAAESALNSVFLRHEWFDAAWQWLRAESELWVACIRRHGHIIGICPLIRRYRKRRGITLRCLEFLSIPDTQLCEIIAAPNDHHLIVNAVGRCLDESSREWDTFTLDKLPRESPTINAFSAAMVKPGRRVLVEESTSSPRVALSCDWDAFYTRRSRRLKKGNNLVANRLNRAYSDVEVRWIRGGNMEIKLVEDALEAVIGLSSRSWKKTTGLTLDNPGPQAFIRALTRHAHTQGWISLWILFLDGIPAAMEYQLIYDKQVHALRADFDQSYQDLSPGTYLNWKLLETLFCDHFDYYDLGPGNNPYKMRWTEESDYLYRVVVFGTTIRGWTMGLFEHAARVVARRISKDRA